MLALKYLRGAVVGYPPKATFGPRTNPDYELVWIIDGDVIYHADGRDYPSPPGSMILCRPGARDAFTWDREHETRHGFFHFDVNSWPSDFPDPSTWPVVQVMPDHDVVRPLFRYILAQCGPYGRHDAALTPMLVRSVETLLGALLLGPLGQAFERRSDLPEPVRRTLDHIRRTLERDPSADLDLQELAQAASTSPEHLCRLFRAAVQMAPMEAVRLHRLDAAVGLLARSNLNVTQIAYRCGFTSPFHFSRRFREAYGKPPRDVRNDIEKGQMPPMNRLIERLHQVGR